MLASQPEKVDAFIRAYLDGLTWVLDPMNEAEAKTILGSRMPQIKPKAMTAVMNSLTSPASGLTPAAALLNAGMDQVIVLRSKYGTGTAPISPVEHFVDLDLYRKAVQA